MEITKTEHYYACSVSDKAKLIKQLGIASDNKLSISKIGEAVGHSIYTTPDKIADRILGLVPPKDPSTKTKYLNTASKNGIMREPETILRYERMLNVKTIKPFFVIPVWNLRLSGIPDRLVGDDGLLEVKSPEKMYPSIDAYEKDPSPFAGRKEKNDYSHIPQHYYDQMMGYMAVFKRKWCDFFVYVEKEHRTFFQRIPFDSKYWEQLHRDITHFLDVKLPERKAYHLTRVPASRGIPFGQHKDKSLVELPIKYLTWNLAGYAVRYNNGKPIVVRAEEVLVDEVMDKTDNKEEFIQKLARGEVKIASLSCWCWVYTNHPQLVTAARSYIKDKKICIHCSEAILGTGDDWEKKPFHYKCWKELCKN